MTQPSSPYNRPQIASYMGTCYLLNGSMTIAKMFVDGGNGFLRDQGKQAASRGTGKRLRVGHNFSHFLGNLWSANAKAEILKREVGRNNNPVIVEYWPKGLISDAGGHYSPIIAYKVRQGGLYLVPPTDIKTIDHPNRWHSLVDPWSPEVGVFYIERY